MQNIKKQKENKTMEEFVRSPSWEKRAERLIEEEE